METKIYFGDIENGIHLDAYIEKLLFEEFNIEKDGIFVDVGAYHPIYLSNSYYFEKYKNFKVLCIEPTPIMFDELKKLRQNVYNYAASDENKDDVDFQFVQGPWDSFGYAGSGLHTYEGIRKETTVVNAHKIEDIKIKTRTLNHILSEAKIDHIDAISIDTEGHELKVLNGLDFDKYAPKVCCIENFFSERWLIDYMGHKGYRYINRLHVDDFFIKIK